MIRSLSRAGTTSTGQSGFRGLGNAAIAIIVSVALGLAFYALQGAPTCNPIVLINAYAQVGVIWTLDASGNLSVFEPPVIPLLVMAVLAIALLIATHVLSLISVTAATPSHVR